MATSPEEEAAGRCHLNRAHNMLMLAGPEFETLLLAEDLSPIAGRTSAYGDPRLAGGVNVHGVQKPTIKNEMIPTDI